MYVAIGGIIIIVIIIVLAMRRGLQMKLLAEKGVRVNGTVIKKFRQVSHKGSMASPCVRYEFYTPQGQRLENKITVTHEVFDQHEQGGEIELVYVPEKPEVNAARYMVNLAREALKLPPV